MILFRMLNLASGATMSTPEHWPHQPDGLWVTVLETNEPNNIHIVLPIQRCNR